MRTGLAKQFKQVLDAQLKRAREAEEELLVEERRTREPKGSHRARRGAGGKIFHPEAAHVHAAPLLVHRGGPAHCGKTLTRLRAQCPHPQRLDGGHRGLGSP